MGWALQPRLTASLRAKTLSTHGSRKQGRFSASWTRFGRRRRDPPTTEPRPLPVTDARGGPAIGEQQRWQWRARRLQQQGVRLGFRGFFFLLKLLMLLGLGFGFGLNWACWVNF
ncbi:uncharacterized protein LOC105791391 [Gossypium raimondii]|uniref:uncharacterized protein LOC105791391 n=1 Tax=Gossypium raimondii TaxID=29730 RepID=UPI00063AA3ED|nr:uncharacterized protein LOC105791391 [Gossypium raimondii]